MNTSQSGVEALSITVSLAAMWWIWSHGLRQAIIEAFRVRVFALRHQLFDMAADGEIAFDSEAYRRMRSFFNGLLRSSERINWFWLLVLIRSSRAMRTDTPFVSALDHSLISLPADQRAKLEALDNRAMALVFDLIGRSSPLLLAISVVVRLCRISQPFIRDLLGRRVASVEAVISDEAMGLDRRCPATA